MKDGIIFVAGIYGVRKSTLCERLSISIGIPCYSAGNLISAINGEIYGRTILKLTDTTVSESAFQNTVNLRADGGL